MVNGKRVDLKIEPRVTLLDAMRKRADLTGNKRVCDRGTCGACTMIVDGRTVYSCSTLAIEVQGKQIRTVDGLASANGTLHPVQQAFCDTDGLMCGFCTPGFVIATVALLEKTSERDARADQQRARRQHLPLRHVRADHGSGDEGARGWLVADPKLRRASPTAQEVRMARKPALLGTSRQAARRPGQGHRAAPSTRTTCVVRG